MNKKPDSTEYSRYIYATENFLWFAAEIYYGRFSTCNFSKTFVSFRSLENAQSII